MNSSSQEKKESSSQKKKSYYKENLEEKVWERSHQLLLQLSSNVHIIHPKKMHDVIALYILKKMHDILRFQIIYEAHR